MDEQESPKDTVKKRFTTLIRRARIAERKVWPRSPDLFVQKEAIKARQSVIAYSNECLSQEVHKDGSGTPLFASEVARGFHAVSAILDRHVAPGERSTLARRGILERAEPFCPSSPHFDAHRESQERRRSLSTLTVKPGNAQNTSRASYPNGTGPLLRRIMYKVKLRPLFLCSLDVTI